MYDYVRIEDIVEHSKDVRSFKFDRSFKFVPGQFIMAWIPGVEEKPFSLSASDEITVKKVGNFTSELFKKKVHDGLHVRGPFGKGFPSDIRHYTVVAGGIGIAPLKGVIDNYPGSNVVFGAKTIDDLVFREYLERHSKISSLILATEDGSYGIKGMVTDIEIPKAHRYAICGPEKMIKKTAEKINDFEHTYVSLERYMKCGIGVCGGCTLGGYCLCTDGPVLNYEKIKDDIGKFKRLKSGKPIDIL